MTVKTTLFALVALSVAGVATSARAGGYGEEWGGREGSWDRWDYVDSFCKEHGVKFSDGYFYPGKVQKHFTESWYDWHFKTYLSFDPHSHMPYYFCEGHGVWYPISYIEKVGPGAKGPGPIVAKPGVGGGAPPAGPGVAPAGGGQPAAGPDGGQPAVAPAAGGQPAGGQPLNGGTPVPAAAGGQGAAAPAAAGGNSPPPEPTSAPNTPAGPNPTEGAAKPVGPSTQVSVARNDAAIAPKSIGNLPTGIFDESIPEASK